jgi:hypothetical protein
LHYNFYILF